MEASPSSTLDPFLTQRGRPTFDFEARFLSQFPPLRAPNNSLTPPLQTCSLMPFTRP